MRWNRLPKWLHRSTECQESEISQMLYGTVVKFFPEKGFGFIKADLGQDVFFHISALGACQPAPEIEAGQAVKYELMSRVEKEARVRPARSSDSDPKSGASPGPQAKLVELIDRIPGASLDDTPQHQQPPRHPRSRKKKPTWRR